MDDMQQDLIHVNETRHMNLGVCWANIQQLWPGVSSGMSSYLSTACTV